MNNLLWIGWNPPFLGSLLAFLVTVFYWIWSRSRFVRLVNALPGPVALPLLGNALDLNVPHDELLKKSAFTWVRKYGGIYRVWFTVRPLVVIASPELMEPIFRSWKHISKGNSYEALTIVAGNSLPVAPDDHWKKSRRLLNPSFHVPVLNTYMDFFNEKSYECGRDFEKAIQINNGAEFDVYPLMNEYTTRAICGSTLECKSFPQEAMQTLLNNCEGLKRIIQYRFSRPWLRSDLLFKFTAMGRENARFARGIHDFGNMLIQKRREFLDREAKAQNHLPSSTSGSSNSEVGNEENVTPRKKLGFIDLILKESDINNNFSKDEIRYEVNSIMITGHDTSALGLTWFLYNMSRYPEHQKLLSEELNAVFGNSDRPCTVQDVADLKYLDCCVKESLRMYPSVPFILRCLPEDTKIGVYNLPKGLMVGLSIVGLHYNPQVFPDPEVFKPERFFAENSSGRHRFAYSAFGAGPRNCIGQKFALLQMKVNIAHLIRRFSFSLANPAAPLIPALQETTLTPKYPIKLIVSKRTN
ncbi:cytochrome P450 4c3-like [Daphnia carinata]|uniref:cytochrome P450 4c3-like n=1 Tax=Daphnia carinata TaxID=120202 RepID=UPI00257FD261|nr:cytochrome P450 4c3-like [Daphnia carinata]